MQREFRSAADNHVSGVSFAESGPDPDRLASFVGSAPARRLAEEDAGRQRLRSTAVDPLLGVESLVTQFRVGGPVRHRLDRATVEANRVGRDAHAFFLPIVRPHRVAEVDARVRVGGITAGIGRQPGPASNGQCQLRAARDFHVPGEVDHRLDHVTKS